MRQGIEALNLQLINFLLQDSTHSFLRIVSGILALMTDINNKMPLLVTAAVIFDDSKILITRRPKDARHPGLWEFPGGKIEAGEGPEEALCREIREELGAEIKVVEVFEVVFHRYDWGPVLVLAYSCRLITKTVHNVGVAEHRWVHPRELNDFNILPADQPIIERLIRGSR